MTQVCKVKSVYRLLRMLPEEGLLESVYRSGSGFVKDNFRFPPASVRSSIGSSSTIGSDWYGTVLYSSLFQWKI